MAARSRPRDRALARLIVATVLRRLGELESGAVRLSGKAAARTAGQPLADSARAAQRSFCFLQRRRTPPSASPSSRRGSIATRAATTGSSTHCCGGWRARARTRWQAAMRCGSTSLPGCLSAGPRRTAETDARRIAEASLAEAALDITVKDEPAGWAERLGGIVLPTGSVRLKAGGRIEDLAGYRGRRVVGAGCCRRAARPAARRSWKPYGCRPVCGTRRQDGRACRCRRPRHGGRAFGHATCAAQGQPRAVAP